MQNTAKLRADSDHMSEIRGNSRDTHLPTVWTSCGEMACELFWEGGGVYSGRPFQRRCKATQGRAEAMYLHISAFSMDIRPKTT